MVSDNTVVEQASTPTPRTDRAARFAAWLQGLVQAEDRAALAALRRGLGKEPGTASEMYRYVMPWISADTSWRDEQNYYLVAALFAWHQVSWVGSLDQRGRSNFGASFKRLLNATESDSMNRYFTALLNSQRAELPHRLRRTVGLLHAHDIPVDWARLLRDLRGWESPSRWVQRQWAQAFWGAPDDQKDAQDDQD